MPDNAQMNHIYNIHASSVQMADTIGRGSFGAVRRATFMMADKRIRAAVKMLSDYQTDSDKEEIENEIRILRQIVHKNIIGMYGCFKSTTGDPGIGIVLELMPCSLNDLLYRFTYVQYKCSQALDWMLQCSFAVAYLHERGTVHRDLKPANMLLDQTFRVLKVSDFGTARYLGTKMTVCKGTTQYMAPEVMVGKEYDARCDVYSIGVILGELVTRRRPETSLGTNAAQIVYRVPRGARPNISSACCSDISKLINKCWLKDAKGRPHVRSICESLQLMLGLRREHPKSSHFILAVDEIHFKTSAFEEVDNIKRKYVHIGVRCRICNKTIRGLRFRCTSCEDYDMCEICHSGGRHNEHICFRFDRPYRDEPRYTDEEILTMERLTIVLKNGRELILTCAMGKRPHHFLLNFATEQHLIALIEGDSTIEQISEDDHFGAYYSDKKQRLDVVMRDMKTAAYAISFILQALDFKQVVVVSAEENVQQIVEGILKTIIFLSITEDFRKIEHLIFYSSNSGDLKAMRRAVEATLFLKEKH
uniref:Mitogen-activated protein kinase kinase kinase n=1 Tax=Parascaris univalens TaxID=6257 RepID=A0A914ZVV8_PARUN